MKNILFKIDRWFYWHGLYEWKGWVFWFRWKSWDSQPIPVLISICKNPKPKYILFRLKQMIW